jgi:AcrR family transcriptional regulator
MRFKKIHLKTFQFFQNIAISHCNTILFISSYFQMKTQRPKENALPWIEAGYRIFSLEGPAFLKVEQLAREVGISKSSFYHHFADVDIFREKLMEFHLQSAYGMAIKAKLCKNLVPDILTLLADHRMDLFFNRQLRIHRNNLSFQLCFQRAHSIVQNEYLHLWAEMLKLQDQPHIAKNILDVVTDLFYQRLEIDTFNYDWIVLFLADIQIFMKEVIKSSGVSSQISH